MSAPAESQAARTSLAWQRTGLSMLLVAGLLARAAAAHGELLLVVPAAIVATAGLVVLGVLAPRRQRHGSAAACAGGDGRAPRSAALVTGLVVGTALCGLAADLAVRS